MSDSQELPNNVYSSESDSEAETEEELTLTLTQHSFNKYIGFHCIFG